MAIEDEIVNISDLDVGSEILKTDKLLIETNNGTKLLDFKDFVIGLDNISFYHLISGRGTHIGTKKFENISGYNVLHVDTDLDHKPTYEDLQGSIELTKLNHSAYTTLQAISSIPEQNQGDIQNILARLGEIVAVLETPQNLSFTPGAKIRLTKVQSWSDQARTGTYEKHWRWIRGRPSDLVVQGGVGGYGGVDEDGVPDGTANNLIIVPARQLGTGAGLPSSVNFKVSVTSDMTLVNDSNLKFNNTNIAPDDDISDGATLVLTPFSMVYPASTTFTTSTISFNAYIEIESAVNPTSPVPITVYIQGIPVRKSYPRSISSNRYIYDFSFVEKVTNEQIVLIKYGTGTKSGKTAPKILAGSSFSGVRMF